MKNNLKKIVAVAAVAAVAVAAVTPLAACGKGKMGEGRFDIKKYAREFSDNRTVANYSGLECTATVSKDEQLVTTHEDLIVIKSKNSDIYRVVNFMSGVTVAVKLAVMPEFIGFSDGVNAVKCVNSAEKSAYIAYDGTVFLDYGNYKYASASKDYYRLRGGAKKSEVLIVTGYAPAEGMENTVGYFEIKTDKSTGGATYIKLDKSDVELEDKDYFLGADRNSLAHDIYEDDSAKPVSGEICEYSVAELGNTYVFYRDNKETGSVKITNGEVLGYLDNMLYYYTMTPVESTAKNGYNVMAVTQYGTVKMNYELHGYNILRNKDNVLDNDLVVMSMTRLYNYEDESYDAAVIQGYTMEDGVALLDGDMFKYAIDKDFKLAYDMEAFSSNDIYNLNDEYFLIGNYITDSNLKIVNSASRENIYPDQRLIKFYYEGYYGFTDFSGKVVIDPLYKTPEDLDAGNFRFFNDYTFTIQKTDDGIVQYALLKSDGTIRRVPNIAYNDFVDVDNGIYSVQAANGSCVIFNFAGDNMGTFPAASDVEIYTHNNKAYISENKSDGSISLYQFISTTEK